MGKGDESIMEVLNMAPAFPIMFQLMGLMGRFLLVISLYYLGKGLWLTIRRRR